MNPTFPHQPTSLQPPLSSATTSPSPAPFSSRMDPGAETTPAPQLPSTAEPSPSTAAAPSKSASSRPAKRVKRDTRKKRDAREDTDVGTPAPSGGASASTTSAAAVGAGGTGTGTATGTTQSTARRKKGAASAMSVIPSLALGLYPPIPPKESYPDDSHPPRARPMTFAVRKHLGEETWDFYEIVEKLSNRNGYRYTSAIDDYRLFPRIRYRSSEVPPYHARLSFEDSTVEMLFTRDGLGVTTNGPWHSARANVCAREGTYYYEARVISGVVRDSHQEGGIAAPENREKHGHVRLGFSRREAELDVNVGHDCYGYGIRDVNGEVVNRMRCKHFMPKGDGICEGDVIGLLITLPPLSLHRKVVEGTYNPAIDGDGTSSTSKKWKPTPVNIIRDRVPFHDKKTSDFLWQQAWINPTKHLRDYAFNLKDTPPAPNLLPSATNTEDPSLRTLPGSSIVIYKNGKRVGTAFENLFAFLPPASRAAPTEGNSEHHERENADDGMIGYFPTISCFRGGAVECRFSSPWWYGPPVDDYPDVEIKSFGDRFEEQIADDVVADIVDEVDAEMQGWSLTEAMAAAVVEDMGQGGVVVGSGSSAAGAAPTETGTGAGTGAGAGAGAGRLPVIPEVVGGAAGESVAAAEEAAGERRPGAGAGDVDMTENISRDAVQSNAVVDVDVDMTPAPAILPSEDVDVDKIGNTAEGNAE